MHRRLKEITQINERAATGLLEAYAPDRLYPFRTSARRIRSILKHIDNHHARVLRKAWGGFAAVTGPARDWDVFLATVDKLGVPEYPVAFADANRERVQSSRDAVIEMLRSAPWRRHLLEWKQFLEHADEREATDGDAAQIQGRALRRAGVALHRAMTIDDDRHWHKFRIAVKEVRYVAEAHPGEPGAEDVMTACRAVQTLLGDWHDTVVQLNLLAELPPEPVHAELVPIIQARKSGFLQQIRERLAQQDLFVPEPPEAA